MAQSEFNRQSALFKNVVRVTCGNFLEMFDFMVYGFYAATIAKVLFPGGDDYAALLLSWMTFGIGFLMRPLGAVVLGAYADRHGRRAGLLLSLSIMASGVVAIAFVPSYAEIGIAAPIIVLIGRLLQGFSAGAESGTVSVYLAEIAPAGREGLFASLQSWSQQWAVMFAACIGIGLRLTLTAGQMDDWGWRVPFIIGSALIPFLLLVRRKIEETEVFQRRASHPSLRQIWQTLLRNWQRVGIAMMMITLTAVMFYLITAYMSGFDSQVLRLPPVESFFATLCVGLVNVLWIPIAAAWSDRFGRTPIMLAASAAIALLSYPAMMWLVAAPSFLRLLEVEILLASLYGMWQGVLIISIIELMPIEVRIAGWSIAYSLTYAIFGGFTPALVTWLIHITGDKAMPGAVLVPAALIGLAGTLMARGHLRAFKDQAE